MTVNFLSSRDLKGAKDVLDQEVIEVLKGNKEILGRAV